MGALSLGILIYTFAGFGVYWLGTGSTTVGVGGSVSNLGGLVWLGPIMALTLVLLAIGDRGPFKVLYLPRPTVDLSDDGLSLWTPTVASRWDWNAIGGVSCLGDGTGLLTTVYGPTGEALGSITGVMTDLRTGRAARLPDVILELRLHEFEAVDARKPGNGCVRRSPRSSGDRSRSAPSAR